MKYMEIKEIILSVVRRAQKLKDTHTDEKGAPVNYACLFAQTDDEWQEMNDAVAATGSVIKETPTGPLYLIQPLKTSAGVLKLIKVRKPDPTRTERGDADFTVADYPSFKSKALSLPGFSLIERPDFEMIELMQKNVPVRAYFSHPPIDVELGV